MLLKVKGAVKVNIFLDGINMIFMLRERVNRDIKAVK